MDGHRKKRNRKAMNQSHGECKKNGNKKFKVGEKPTKGKVEELRRKPPVTTTNLKHIVVNGDGMDESSLHGKPQYGFEVDDADHCETPFLAYEHIALLLDAVARKLKKSRKELRIYDPYFCSGKVKAHLGRLGFDNVYNECEDFYERVKKKRLPPYDVLVTNPPFSRDHINRLLHFVCQKQRKPFFLLMPNYVYTKEFYGKSVGLNQVKFLVPSTIRYNYEPPPWTGSTCVNKAKQTTSPFHTFWYCCFNGNDWAAEKFPDKITFVNQQNKKTTDQTQLLLVNDIPSLPYWCRGELDSTRKRPNPKTRKKLKKRRLEQIRNNPI